MAQMSRTLVLVVVSIGLLAHCEAKLLSYQGYSVHRCIPQTLDQLESLRSLESQENNNGVQFWSEANRLNGTVDILVAPQSRESFLGQLQRSSIECHQTIGDVDEAIMRTMPVINRDHLESANSTDGLKRGDVRASEAYYRQYHSYEQIEAKLRDLAELDPRVSLQTIGYSFEKRKLYLVKVSNDPAANKPVIFIDAGHHAREWISHSTAIYLLESLVNIDMPRMAKRDCQLDSCRRELDQRTRLDLDNFDYWFLPVVNPDGYEYTHRVDRLWRKTRSQNSGICFALNGMGRGDGVDPNRNYPFHWMEAGASSFACSETYAGPRPLSEPETRALAQVLEQNKARIVMYVSFHSFSQLILAPYGYGRVLPDNFGELQRVANQWIQSVAKLRGTDYEFGTSAIKLYPAAGGSDDFAHGVAGIKLAYTIELPDKGRNHFLLPPSEIIPVGQEAIIGLRAMSDAALKSV